MRTQEKIVAGGVFVVIAVLLVAFFSSQSAEPAKVSVGGTFSPVAVDFAQGVTVNNALVINNRGAFIGPMGGNVATIATTSTSYTLASTDLDLENVIDVTPGGASLTLTLPATSTLTSFLPVTGQTRTIFIRNATTTAGINLTIAGGAGTVLRSSSSTAIIQSDTAGAKAARLEFVRRSTGDIGVYITTFNN